LPQEFKLASAKKAGIEVYILLPKESDQMFGYVIYEVPPVGHTEIVVGPEWSREEIERMKDDVRHEIGGNVTMSMSRITIVREENGMTEEEIEKKEEERLQKVGKMMGELFLGKPDPGKTATSKGKSKAQADS
jgi:hypothetical protein